MGWTFVLKCHRRLAFLLSRSETVGKNRVALDGAIEIFPLTNQHVAQFKRTALKVSDAFQAHQGERTV